MTITAPSQNTRAIVVEEVLPHTPEKIWQVLTRPDLIARWLMDNDFRPEHGHTFHFQAQPMADWNGKVECEILEIDEPNRLVYTWKGGSTGNPEYGSLLDSVLTWELTPVEGGTKLRMVHDGFRSPDNDFGYDAMSGGWNSKMPKISEIAAGL